MCTVVGIPTKFVFDMSNTMLMGMLTGAMEPDCGVCAVGGAW